MHLDAMNGCRTGSVRQKLKIESLCREHIATYIKNLDGVAAVDDPSEGTFKICGTRHFLLSNTLNNVTRPSDQDSLGNSDPEWTA